MDIDPKCYTFNKLETTDGFLDKSVDATYVITLEGSDRYERIHTQFKEYHPTRIVYIMTNRGYKRCNKRLRQNLPRYDLTDAFINVFRHAKKQGYRNILVLEDDFIFDKKILKEDTLAIVNKFVIDRTSTDFIYLLGCLPQFQVPYDRYHNRPVSSGGTHAVIYSKSFRERTINEYDLRDIGDWDTYCKEMWERFTFHEPLAYQLFPLTDNRKQWDAPEFILYLADIVLRFFRLDKDIEPGYSFFYALSKGLFFLAVMAVILFAYIAYRFARHYLSN